MKNDSPPPPLSVGPIAGSKKVYAAGTIHPDLRVPFREVALHPSAKEPPVTIYDPSGPYTDPDATIDLNRGLPPLRSAWLAGDDRLEVIEGRVSLPADDGHPTARLAVPPFSVQPLVRRARSGARPTQLAAARAAASRPKWSSPRCARTYGDAGPFTAPATVRTSAPTCRTSSRRSSYVRRSPVAAPSCPRT